MTSHRLRFTRFELAHLVRARRTIIAILLLLMVVAACSSGNDDSSQSSADVTTASAGAVAADTGDRAEADFETAGEDAGFDDDGDSAAEPAEAPSADGSANAVTTGSAAGQPTAQLPDLGRDIIYTAELELASTDVSAATREAIRSVEARGGFLFSQDTRGGSGGSSVLVFKVLPDQFQAALNDLGSIGTVRSQSISADDVTAIVVDLESRINTAEASVERLRKLLDEANALDVIATLENQLLVRETTLEQLRGQLRSVQNQVDLATITVYVTELLNRPSLALDVTTFAGHDGGFSCFDSASARTGESGDPMTICYQVINTGDTPLVDLRIDDPVLGISIGNMVLVDGEVTQIDPGESVLLAYEFELDESLRVRTSVTATGLDADGNALDDEVLATAPTIRFEVTEVDDGIPSFGDVLSGSVSALATIAIVIALVAVAVAPFLLVALVLSPAAIWAVRRYRRRTSARAAASGPATPAAPPAPPTAPPPPAPPAPPAPRAPVPATAATPTTPAVAPATPPPHPPEGV